ncbi:hypothetical protein NDU88_000417 [Pleurodeles waltl]|uniref:Uncharacterized protein n=1 Tax=Pleurodeles waltl TaxID=8319 RepID=A0AAV7V516_PLEWA|nr:hypothetical protein NDU88_000417 [Pleurodeles waltl]
MCVRACLHVLGRWLFWAGHELGLDFHGKEPCARMTPLFLSRTCDSASQHLPAGLEGLVRGLSVPDTIVESGVPWALKIEEPSSRGGLDVTESKIATEASTITSVTQSGPMWEGGEKKQNRIYEFNKNFTNLNINVSKAKDLSIDGVNINVSVVKDLSVNGLDINVTVVKDLSVNGLDINVSVVKDLSIDSLNINVSVVKDLWVNGLDINVSVVKDLSVNGLDINVSVVKDLSVNGLDINVSVVKDLSVNGLDINVTVVKDLSVNGLDINVSVV